MTLVEKRRQAIDALMQSPPSWAATLSELLAEDPANSHHYIKQTQIGLMVIPSYRLAMMHAVIQHIYPEIALMVAAELGDRKEGDEDPPQPF